MNAATAPQSSSRLIAIALFIGLPALLLAMATMNFLEVADDQFVVAEKDMQLAAFMRRLTAPARDGKPVDLSQIYVVGQSATLASANLQQYLVKSVAGASGKLIETSVADPEIAADAAPDNSIGIRTSFDIDNAGLLTLLHGLESGLPLITIDTLAIRRLPDDSNGKAAGMLRVDLDARARWKDAI